MDSQAAFAERAKQVGITQDHIDLLTAKNLDTYGAFAFISSFQPGGTDESPFVRALHAALGLAANTLNEGQLASFRRLYFESHTLAMGDLRSRLERRDNEEPRKIPMAERAQRLEALRTQLSGVTIDVQLEPAHRLVDMAVQQVEENSLRYIAPKDCLSRSSELLNHKHESALEFSNDGTLKLTKRQKELQTDIQGDLKLRMALQRHALAYQMAGASDFKVQDKIISSWFSLLTKEPVSGYRAISLQQIILADQELWLLAAQEVRGKVMSSTPKPLDEALIKLADSTEVKYHLLPLPSSSKKAHDEQPSKKQKFKPDDRPSHTNDKGGGKGKKKGAVSLPKGCVAVTPAGLRICFQYNRKRCNNQSNDKCNRGLHVCWKEGCHKKHPAGDCEMQ